MKNPNLSKQIIYLSEESFFVLKNNIDPSEKIAHSSKQKTYSSEQIAYSSEQKLFYANKIANRRTNKIYTFFYMALPRCRKI